MTTMNPSQHYPDEDGDKPNVKSVAPEARFQASGYKDVWAAILFLIATAAFGFVSYLGITFLRIRLNNTQGLSLTNVGSLELAVVFGIAIACGGLLGLGFFMLLQVFAGKLIVMMMVVNILSYAALFIIWTVIRKDIAVSVVLFVALAIVIWSCWSSRSKIVFFI
jgi:hypothetical protein